MSDQYVNQPAPGQSSQEGAYSRQPQQPSYYFNDSNQYGVYNAQAAFQPPVQNEAVPRPQQADESTLVSWVNFSDPTYLKGIALGAGIALVATNPQIQKAVVSGAVKLWAALQGGVEEIKEQIQDVKAELSQQE